MTVYWRGSACRVSSCDCWEGRQRDRSELISGQCMSKQFQSPGVDWPRLPLPWPRDIRPTRVLPKSGSVRLSPSLLLLARPGFVLPQIQQWCPLESIDSKTCRFRRDAVRGIKRWSQELVCQPHAQRLPWDEGGGRWGWGYFFLFVCVSLESSLQRVSFQYKEGWGANGQPSTRLPPFLLWFLEDTSGHTYLRSFLRRNGILNKMVMGKEKHREIMRLRRNNNY